MDRDGATPLTRSADVLFWVTALACAGGFLTYSATGFLDPEAGSGTGEDLFITLSPSVVLAALLWLPLRRVPAIGAASRLLVLAVGWGLFLATR